jgi:hypothetical protein
MKHPPLLIPIPAENPHSPKHPGDSIFAGTRSAMRKMSQPGLGVIPGWIEPSPHFQDTPLKSVLFLAEESSRINPSAPNTEAQPTPIIEGHLGSSLGFLPNVLVFFLRPSLYE